MRCTVDKANSEIYQVAEQCQQADNNDDDTYDALGAAVDRQLVDEIKHKQNDDEAPGSGCPCQSRLSFTAKQA